MSIDAHVPSRAAQGLALSIWDVLLRFGVSILLRHSKVDNMDNVCSFCARSADKEVVRFNVAVDEVLLVNSLDASDHLFGRHAHRFDRKLPPTHVEEVLQAESKEVNDENIMQAFLAEVVDLRDPNTTRKNSIRPTFVPQLRCFSFPWFKLNSNRL